MRVIRKINLYFNFIAEAILPNSLKDNIKNLVEKQDSDKSQLISAAGSASSGDNEPTISNSNSEQETLLKKKTKIR